MTLPDYTSLIAGTPQVWTSSGGTKTLDATSLAASRARQGVKSASLWHGTYGAPEFLEIKVEAKPTSAPTDGGTVEVWIGESSNASAGTDNPAGLTGADGTVSSTSTLEAEAIRNLKAGPAIICGNSTGAAIQTARGLYYPACEYICPVLYNRTSVALSGTGTDHKITVTPYYRAIID